MQTQRALSALRRERQRNKFAKKDEEDGKNGWSRGYKLISLERNTKLRARHERKAQKMRVAFFFKRDFKINGHQARKSI